MRTMPIQLTLLLILASALGGCQTHLRHNLGSPADAYAARYPIYAELCAASQFRKRPEIDPPIKGGGFGGHAVLYLNGVCVAPDGRDHYPRLAICNAKDGVGLSINAHYKNANWVATPGHDFFFHGLLHPDERLTRPIYDATIARAQALGILDGIEFHDDVFAEIPKGTSVRDYKYQVSLGTDFALNYARDRYCARVPLSADQMEKVIRYLNDTNEPYRTGARTYQWNVLRDNCSHLIRNALAAANVWQGWGTNRGLLISAFDFPVPKNELVNLMRHTNDGPFDDLEKVYDDEESRRAIMEQDRLATAPGGLADFERMAIDNEVYDPNVRLVFYGDPIFGSYERRFSAIKATPRYYDLKANDDYFRPRYRAILASKKPLSLYLAHMAQKSEAERSAFSAFYNRYYDYIDREFARLEQAAPAP